MSDRLEEIKQRWAEIEFNPDGDFQWLVCELERLRAALSGKQLPPPEGWTHFKSGVGIYPSALGERRGP